MGEALDILGVIDTLDVPGLAVLTVYGFWRLHKTVSKGMALQQQAFVAALHAIELRLQSNTTSVETLAEQFKAHAAADSEHFTRDAEDKRRIFDKIDELRRQSHA